MSFSSSTVETNHEQQHKKVINGADPGLLTSLGIALVVKNSVDHMFGCSRSVDVHSRRGWDKEARDTNVA
jgi:hypothetical protein